MREDWGQIQRELDRWAAQGLIARFWVRDDDAREVSRPLIRLRALAEEHNITIGLAVIPGLLNPDVLDILAAATQPFFPMCHGWKHINHGTKKKPSEFGNNRSFSSLLGDAVFAYDKFCEFFDTKAIFVPPYNSITKTLIAALPDIGYAGLSGGPSGLEARIARLVGKVWTPAMRIPVWDTVPRIDAQIDVIDWRRRTVKNSRMIAENIIGHLRLRRRGFIDIDRPIGLLTHHLVHDEETWRSCDELLHCLGRHKAATFLDISKEL